MPWATPTLRDVRTLVRDSIRAFLPGSDATPQNSVLRVLSDAQGALTHLTLQYIDWLALQLLPDTAEEEWLDRHGQIWLVNSDGTTGRKLATLASGTCAFTALATGNGVIPMFSQLTGANNILYETIEEIAVLANETSSGLVRAVDPGTIGNQVVGAALSFITPPVNISAIAFVETMQGGIDQETTEELRSRVLERIRKPPMGGDKDDYEEWALAVPGVTRAWCSPLEMGIGTITVRFMMDDVNADNGGFPTGFDIQAVTAYLNTVRPVTVEDFWVVAPIPQPIDVFISHLNPDTDTIRALIQTSLEDMIFQKSAPGQTIFTAWKYYAIMNTPGVISFDLEDVVDDVMTSPGHLAVLGDINYASEPVSTP